MPIIYLVRKDSIPVYVGFTSKSLEKRWGQHVKDCSKNNGCPILCNAIAKYGVDAFTIEEIYSSDDVDHTLNVMEPHFIREHHTHKDEGGYNISYGGDAPALGIKHTEKNKEKISLGQKERYRNLSEEDREKMRIRMRELRKYRTKEGMKKIGLANRKRRGKKLTESHKKNIGLASKLSWIKRKQSQLSTPPPSA